MRYLFALSVVDDGDNNPVIVDHHFTGFMSDINDHINGMMDELVGVLYQQYGWQRWPRRVTQLPPITRHWVGKLPLNWHPDNVELHKRGVGYFICRDDTYNKWDQARYELPSRLHSFYDSDYYGLGSPFYVAGDTITIGTTTVTVDGTSFFQELNWEPITLDPERFRWITRGTAGRLNVQGNNFTELRPPDPGLPDQ